MLRRAGRLKVWAALMVASSVALVLVSAAGSEPAKAAVMAQDSQEEADYSIVYFPYGNGAAYSCTGGAPFVFDLAGQGNCSIEQIGAPIGVVCDVPTTLTFVHEGHEWVSEASLCH